MSVSILSDGFRKEQAFPYLLPKGKFGYDATQVISISLARYLIKDCLILISNLHQRQSICFLQICV